MTQYTQSDVINNSSSNTLLLDIINEIIQFPGLLRFSDIYTNPLGTIYYRDLIFRDIVLYTEDVTMFIGANITTELFQNVSGVNNVVLNNTPKKILLVLKDGIDFSEYTWTGNNVITFPNNLGSSEGGLSGENVKILYIK